MGSALDLTLAVLNGLVGDHLVRTRNGLATELGFVQSGERLPPVRSAFEKRISAVVVKTAGMVLEEIDKPANDGSGG